MLNKVYNTGLLAVAAACMIVSCSALCPGESPCSGHGTCGASDKCTCFTGYEREPDCSVRACPTAISWGVPSTGLHTMTECADRGTCDRENAVCECFEGFEGAACQRLSCQDNCSGHGVCKTLSELSSGAYTGWDKDMIQACECDSGFQGVTCADRKCITGDDPLTTTAILNEKQTINPYSGHSSSGGLDLVTGTFLLAFTDWRGERLRTAPIDISTATTQTIKEYLEALPNQAVGSVTVTENGGPRADPNTLTWDIEFTGAQNTGDIPLLEIEYAGCKVAGCQPYYDGLTTANSSPYVPTAVTAVDGTTENAVCSNRGKCNKESGVCKCFAGFTGEACGTQTVMT